MKRVLFMFVACAIFVGYGMVLLASEGEPVGLGCVMVVIDDDLEDACSEEVARIVADMDEQRNANDAWLTFKKTKLVSSIPGLHRGRDSFVAQMSEWYTVLERVATVLQDDLQRCDSHSVLNDYLEAVGDDEVRIRTQHDPFFSKYLAVVTDAGVREAPYLLQQIRMILARCRYFRAIGEDMCSKEAAEMVSVMKFVLFILHEKRGDDLLPLCLVAGSFPPGE